LFRRCGNRFDRRQGTALAASAIPRVWLYFLRAPSMRLITAFSLLILVFATAARAGAVDDCNQVRDLNRQLRGCTAYIQSHPAQPGNLATAFLNRANIYARRGQYEKAFADYKRALELDPSNPLIPYNMGNAYLDRGEPAQAAEAFSLAVNLDSEFALAYFNRGIARRRLGDSTGANEDFRRTLELDPKAEHARQQLGGFPTQ
jgi:tetratricopeptide (TPR) repeat protein